MSMWLRMGCDDGDEELYEAELVGQNWAGHQTTPELNAAQPSGDTMTSATPPDKHQGVVTQLCVNSTTLSFVSNTNVYKNWVCIRKVFARVPKRL